MTVEEYLENAPEPQRSALRQLRSTLQELIPDAEETMSYGMPSFKIKGKAVAGYAYFKNHCSYFPHSSTVLDALAGELGDYERSKGTLKFAVDDYLPPDLVRRLVEARLDELRVAEG